MDVVSLLRLIQRRSGDAPLTFWEWLAYAGIFVAALIITADTGFKLAPDVTVHLPAFFHSAWWGFASVVLVVASTVILLLREFVFAPRTREFALTHVQAPTQEAPATERLFVGEDITLKCRDVAFRLPGAGSHVGSLIK